MGSLLTVTLETAMLAAAIAAGGTVPDKGSFGSGSFFIDEAKYFSKAIWSQSHSHSSCLWKCRVTKHAHTAITLRPKGLKFGGLIFAEQSRSTKTTKIMPSKNFPLYSRTVTKIYCTSHWDTPNGNMTIPETHIPRPLGRRRTKTLISYIHILHDDFVWRMPALTIAGEPAVVDSTSRNVLFLAGGILWIARTFLWSGNMGRSSRLHSYYKYDDLFLHAVSLSSYTGHGTLTVAIKHS